MPHLKDDTVVHSSITEVAEFEDGFWNLSEVGFLNNEEVESIQLIVDLDLNSAKKIKNYEGKNRSRSRLNKF